MDPVANTTYELVETLLTEFDTFFPADFPYWHLGGDEVEYKCWKSSDGGYIDTWMREHGLAAGDYAALQSYFEGKVIDIVRKVSRGRKRTILWEDNSGHHTSGLPKDAVVELWKERRGNSLVLDATVKAGWKVLYTSPDWYFDHWLSKSNLEVGDWTGVYQLDPYEGSTLSTAELDASVLGGEGCAWSPYFDDANILTQVFPRAAAVAERLWSNRSVTSISDATARLHQWRCLLLRRGLATAPVYGGIPVGATGTHPWGGDPTVFGGHCASGPWHPVYSPPFEV